MEPKTKMLSTLHKRLNMGNNTKPHAPLDRMYHKQLDVATT